MTASDDWSPRHFYHRTRADLKPGDLIEAGYSSNYGARKQGSWVYLTGTLDATIWGAELAAALMDARWQQRRQIGSNRAHFFLSYRPPVVAQAGR